MQLKADIFKAYDVRGVYPDEFYEDVAYLIGRAFADFAKAGKIIIGQDMRTSSPALAQKFAQGVTDQGVDAIMLGEVSTDALYFASGKLGYPSAMFTASHNPPQYNGIKFCRSGAEPISSETGLEDIKNLVIKEGFSPAKKKGEISQRDILPDYSKHVLSFIDKGKIKPLKVAVDAGNGMAGKIIPLVFGKLPCKILPLFFELDGTFPNHEANPIKPENVAALRTEVLQQKADIGLAFDGDADRVFFIDEKGDRVSSSLITAMVADQILAKNPGAKIIYNVPSSKIVPETIKAKGGEPILERVGHSFIKATMKATDAIFGGEHSGHYYFRDNFRADSGLIASLIVLEILSQSDMKFSELLAPFAKYYAIEETNFKVTDKKKALADIKAKYSDAKISDIDGLTFTYPDYWFNVRPSNTEPTLRLNLEANSAELMEAKTKELSKVINNS